MEKCMHYGKDMPYWTVTCPHCGGHHGYNL
ncbi:hypothetical protein VPHD69_0116 [Vibrio phage D69]